MTRMLQSLKKAAAILGCVGLAGCSSFLDPTAERVDLTDLAKRAEAGNQTVRISLPEAERDAFRLKDAYRKRISDEVLLRNLSNAAFIPLAGAAAFYGITGAHSDVILSLSLGGTGAYLIGETFTSIPRQYIYAGGIAAVDCILDSYRPIRDAHHHRPALLASVGGASFDGSGAPVVVRGRLLTLIDRLSPLLPAPTANEPTVIAEARAAITRAREVRTRIGMPALSVLDGAGMELRIALSTVRTEVTRALITQQLNPGTLQEAVAQAFAGTIATLPDAAPEGGASTKGAERGSIAKQDDIIRLTADLTAASQAVEDIAFQIKQPPNLKSLERCAIDVDER